MLFSAKHPATYTLSQGAVGWQVTLKGARQVGPMIPARVWEAVAQGRCHHWAMRERRRILHLAAMPVWRMCQLLMARMETAKLP